VATKRTRYARQSQSAFCGRKTETQFEKQQHCQHPFFMALDERERKNRNKKNTFLYSRNLFFLFFRFFSFLSLARRAQTELLRSIAGYACFSHPRVFSDREFTFHVFRMRASSLTYMSDLLRCRPLLTPPPLFFPFLFFIFHISCTVLNQSGSFLLQTVAMGCR
jgi:hypothetical protein